MRLSKCSEPKDHIGGLLKQGFQTAVSPEIHSQQVCKRFGICTFTQHPGDPPSTSERHCQAGWMRREWSRGTTLPAHTHFYVPKRKTYLFLPRDPRNLRNKCNQIKPMGREEEDKKCFHKSLGQNGASRGHHKTMADDYGM